MIVITTVAFLIIALPVFLVGRIIFCIGTCCEAERKIEIKNKSIESNHRDHSDHHQGDGCDGDHCIHSDHDHSDCGDHCEATEKQKIKEPVIYEENIEVPEEIKEFLEEI